VLLKRAESGVDSAFFLPALSAELSAFYGGHITFVPHIDQNRWDPGAFSV
jgi:hypothetical protein